MNNEPELTHDSEMLNEYDFSQGTTNQKSIGGGVSDLIASGASAILSLFPPTAAVGAMGSFGLFVWQREQLNKFITECQHRFEALDQNKLDQSALTSDEFKSLVVQAVETASQTASDLKQQALSKALANSIILPTSRFTGKQTLLRILTQLSDEEMLVLKVLYDESASFKEIHSTTSPSIHLGMGEADIATRLSWSEEDALVTCQSLRQLGLVHEPDPDPNTSYFLADESADDSVRGWRVTALAEKLIRWCHEAPIEQRNF